MATTIKLKNGSGAPLAGDLVQGEPALDLTNKRLYTEDSSGTVIEVGTNPTSLTTGTFTSTGIDDNATSTAITIDSSENVGIGTASPSSLLDVSSGTNTDGTDVTITVGGTSANTRQSLITKKIQSSDRALEFYAASGSSSEDIRFFRDNTNETMRIDSSGNVGIGTTSPNSNIADGIDCNSTLYGRYDFTSGVPSTGLGMVCTADGNVGGFSSGDLVLQCRPGVNSRSIRFFTGNTSTERMQIDASGNVGIGTTSPATTLHLETSGNTGIQIRSGTTSSYGNINFNDGATAKGQILYDHNGDYMRMYVNGAERMRIDSSGNVGIGTSSPARILHVEQDGLADLLLRDTSAYSAGTGPAVVFQGRDSGETITQFGAIYGVSNGSNSGELKFETRNAGTSAERMRLHSSGSLSIGTTAGSTAAAGNIILAAGAYIGAFNGDNQIRSSSAGAGSATLYIGNAAIQVSSDRRLKENIVDTSMSALDKLDQVRVVDFTWNDPSDTAVNNRNARGTWTGIIAQELVNVFPFAVNAPRNEDDLTIDEESESTWQVDQDQLVPVLIKAIQELKAEVAALKGA